MPDFIKYKRIYEHVTRIELETLFDKIITEGWTIITYFEVIDRENPTHIYVTIIVGKKQINVL